MGTDTGTVRDCPGEREYTSAERDEREQKPNTHTESGCKGDLRIAPAKTL